VFVNRRVSEFTGLSKEQMAGKSLWKLFPDVVGTSFEHELRRAMAEQAPVRFEHFYAPWKRWFENHVYPSLSGLSLFVADITERKQAEHSLREADRQKDEFLAMLAHELAIRSPHWAAPTSCSRVSCRATRRCRPRSRWSSGRSRSFRA
jgi:PAS domain S-box-containing protein